MQGSDNAILILDEQEERKQAVSSYLSGEGYSVSTARTWKEVFESCGDGEYPSVVADFRPPRLSEMGLAKRVKATSPDTRVVLVTDREMLDKAVQAMREGSVDGLLGCHSLERLEHSVRKVIELLPQRGGLERPVITCSPKMEAVLKMAGRIARSNATVLIQGETGTGKEMVARHIHMQSSGRSRPFVAVNCAALPESLLESELFGHEKGAFTGAQERKLGKFEVAQGGTLLLDEISEMGLVAQAKLLRVLQEREVDRVGGKEPVPIDVRVIATTNRDLRREVAAGRFREDLYYRLNVINIKMPPLRERREDIPLLARHFIEKFCRLNGMETLRLEESAERMLAGMDWKGNVRELENLAEKAVLLSVGDTLTKEDFIAEGGPCQDTPSPAVKADGSMKDVERQMIYNALEEAGGNKTHAARKLGVSSRTIRNKLKEYEKTA